MIPIDMHQTESVNHLSEHARDIHVGVIVLRTPILWIGIHVQIGITPAIAIPIPAKVLISSRITLVTNDAGRQRNGCSIIHTHQSSTGSIHRHGKTSTILIVYYPSTRPAILLNGMIGIPKHALLYKPRYRIFHLSSRIGHSVSSQNEA